MTGVGWQLEHPLALLLGGMGLLLLYLIRRKAGEGTASGSLLKKGSGGLIRKTIPEFLDKWQKAIGVNVKEVKIKKMKTKWGACNADHGRIWLNLELAKNPLRCTEYVLVHELIHFHEKTHSDRFFNLLDTHMPKWDQQRDELNNSVLGFFPWEH